MKRTPKILLISSDAALVRSVAETTAPISGLTLEAVATVEDACSASEQGQDVVMVLHHLRVGGSVAGVTRVLQAFALEQDRVGVLVIGDEYRPDQALTLLRLGVADYLFRPLDLSRLAYLIELFTMPARHGRERRPGPPVEDSAVVSLAGPDGHFLYTTFSQTERMIEQVRRIAALDTTIMLEGETGTGKSRFASVIHSLSPRRAKPFLVVNCGALSTNLIESEMFGHVRGAFTGADADRTGKLTAVGRGTLFLDEVDSLPLPVQAKLLRAVEERIFEPVGSNHSQHLQARLIVASNRPLEQEVAAGRFRPDLFYRLNVVAFALEPLRQRLGAIPALAQEFLNEFAARTGRSIQGIAPETMNRLLAHTWPGNIRELRNVIERAVALCDGPIIGVEALPASFQTHAAPHAEATSAVPERALANLAADANPLARSRAQAESGVIADALLRNGGNRLRAAADLGISRKTLYQKLNRYGLMGSH
jgi:two-component system response regulator HydG